MLKKSVCLVLLCTLLLCLICSCGNTGAPTSKVYYEYFNTETVVSVYDGGEVGTEELFGIVTDTLDEYHKLFDIYLEYSGVTNLCTVNREAGVSPVRVDEKLIDFLIYAKGMHTLTGGEMSIALGAVTRLWHDCREAAEADPVSAKIPEMAALTAAAEHTDIDSLVIDPEAKTVYFSDSALRLDVGAIGKGYATEKLRQRLVEAGVKSCVLNVGGNIAIIGKKPDGSDFLTGITNPKKAEPGQSQLITTVELSDVCCVTSGDYERYYTVDGVKYHHVIDKDTLFPGAYFASVTVICKDGALADALSTALFCMTEEEGRELLNNICNSGAADGGIQVLWIDKDNNITRYGGDLRNAISDCIAR